MQSRLTIHDICSGITHHPYRPVHHRSGRPQGRPPFRVDSAKCRSGAPFARPAVLR